MKKQRSKNYLKQNTYYLLIHINAQKKLQYVPKAPVIWVIKKKVI